jgi:hypothetical protein
MLGFPQVFQHRRAIVRQAHEKQYDLGFKFYKKKIQGAASHPMAVSSNSIKIFFTDKPD